MLRAGRFLSCPFFLLFRAHCSSDWVWPHRRWQRTSSVVHRNQRQVQFPELILTCVRHPLCEAEFSEPVLGRLAARYLSLTANPE